MRKKNGFISMSIVYSFFAVFTLVSTSLLLIYSNNISIVKNINREVKKELVKKGNESLLVFENLIKDGSFESVSSNWVNLVTSRQGNTGVPVYDEQQYYGKQSLGMVYNRVMSSETVENTSQSTMNYVIRSKSPINLKKNHIYYISRIYLAYNHILGSDIYLYLTPKSLVEGTDSKFKGTNAETVISNISGSSFDILKSDTDKKTVGYSGKPPDTGVLYNTNINRSRNRRESGFCAGVNNRQSTCKDGTYANTWESGMFVFTKNDGEYYLVIGANFKNWDSKENPFRSSDGSACGNINRCGVPPRYYTDGYMLFDLTVALQLKDTSFKCTDDSKAADRVHKIDDLLDARYFEGRKEFAAHRLKFDAC